LLVKQTSQAGCELLPDQNLISHFTTSLQQANIAPPAILDHSS
jgi:hypothetical protein